MTSLLPVVSIFMLALSTLVLELSFKGAGERPSDLSHLDDPNPHLEELVVCAEVSERRITVA